MGIESLQKHSSNRRSFECASHTRQHSKRIQSLAKPIFKQQNLSNSLKYMLKTLLTRNKFGGEDWIGMFCFRWQSTLPIWLLQDHHSVFFTFLKTEISEGKQHGLFITAGTHLQAEDHTFCSTKSLSMACLLKYWLRFNNCRRSHGLHSYLQNG